MCQGLWAGGVRQQEQHTAVILPAARSSAGEAAHPPALGHTLHWHHPRFTPLPEHPPQTLTTSALGQNTLAFWLPFLLSLCDHLLHFIYYSSWFKILLCMWALCMWSIISPWIWGCWVGEGREKKSSWVFQATPFDLQSKYISAVCRKTLVQGRHTAVMEPGDRTRAAPLQQQHMGHFCLLPPTDTTLSPPPQGCQPAGKELR